MRTSFCNDVKVSNEQSGERAAKSKRGSSRIARIRNLRRLCRRNSRYYVSPWGALGGYWYPASPHVCAEHYAQPSSRTGSALFRSPSPKFECASSQHCRCRAHRRLSLRKNAVAVMSQNGRPSLAQSGEIDLTWLCYILVLRTEGTPCISLPPIHTGLRAGLWWGPSIISEEEAEAAAEAYYEEKMNEPACDYSGPDPSEIAEDSRSSE